MQPTMTRTDGGVSVLALALLAACNDEGSVGVYPSTSDTADDGSTTHHATADDSGGTTSTTSATSTTEPEGSTESGSSTGEIGDVCPPASADIGAILGVHLAETWIFEGRSGISEGICEATAYDGSRLTLECVRIGREPDVHVMGIDGGGPVVADALGQLVGVQDLQLSLPYGLGFFPGFYSFDDFTLRTSSGDLLVLAARGFEGPGGSIVGVEDPEWTAPFAEPNLVDRGCAFRSNPEDDFPGDSQPFAVEVETDQGSMLFFEGQQGSVDRDAVEYEVSVTKAHTHADVCADCPESETAISIVRRP